MNKNFDITYKGSLRCQAVHLKSGSEIETDAPIDNNGKGEKFSPTDLLATALTTCMLTVVGIHFKNSGKDLKDIRCEVEKIMKSDPRRVGEIKIEFDFGENNFTEAEKRTVKRLAEGCPVARSLSEDIIVSTNL